jgi:hypothetical protein
LKQREWRVCGLVLGQQQQMQQLNFFNDLVEKSKELARNAGNVGTKVADFGQKITNHVETAIPKIGNAWENFHPSSYE